jgi:hypothetical protein
LDYGKSAYNTRGNTVKSHKKYRKAIEGVSEIAER